MSDRFEKGTHPRLRTTPLRVLPDAALNAECPTHLLDDPITPMDRFFVRNNGDLPEFSSSQIAEWSVSIEGEVLRPSSFTVPELKAKFQTVSVVSVLECAGNGRSEFIPPVDGLQWSRGAVACVEWTGVRLQDVLRHCGLTHAAIYTAHHSPDTGPASSEPAISRGLPIEKALAEETLLAFEANGKLLELLHGGPLRVVAPGFPGSAWQKWIERISVLDRVHDGAKMNGTDYRLPRVPIKPGDPIRPEDFEIIEAMPINAVITFPADRFFCSPSEEFEVSGFAWCGDSAVIDVSISTDSGRSWTQASLSPQTHRFGWRRFCLRVSPQATPIEIIARATDANGRTQPMDSAPWNPRGYCNNSAHRIRPAASRN